MSIRNFQIVETTLREGEQAPNVHFTTDQKLEIARALDDFGVEYIELTSPMASEQSFADARRICSLGLRAKILTHVRCHLTDVQRAIDTGVDGINMLFGSSEWLRRYSHGRDIDQIIEQATDVAAYVKRSGVEIRYSNEDAFRTAPADLLRIYQAVDAIGVNRVGLADTVGIATPLQVHNVVAAVADVVQADIEFHGHNDTGCAIANALMALEGGASLIDVTVLGIGERNGITPLGGLIARLYAIDRALVQKYQLRQLAELERRVAAMIGMEVPMNNYITGGGAFYHKAGLHTNAVLRNPRSYEIFDPDDFGMHRTIEVGHRLAGRNALKARAQQLGLRFSDDELRRVARQVKNTADQRPLSADEVDSILRDEYSALEMAA